MTRNAMPLISRFCFLYPVKENFCKKFLLEEERKKHFILSIVTAITNLGKQYLWLFSSVWKILDMASSPMTNIYYAALVSL